MTLSEKLSEAQTLWKSLVTFCPAPPDVTFIRWVSRFSTDELMRGMTRTSSKFQRETNFDPESCYRYATSVMHNESMRQRGEAE